MIPEKLNDPRIKFCRILKGTKKPFEMDWNNKPYSYEEISKYNNENYGVMGGGSKQLLIIDFDNEELQNKIIPLLPDTFTVKTGTGKYHKYFFSDSAESFKIFDKDMNTLADIQGEGKQVVGAGSIHPNGNKYEVIEDKEIAFLPYAEIKALLIPYDKKPKKEVKEFKQPEGYYNDSFVDLVKSRISLKDILNDCGVDTSKNPTNCPFHSSKGGKCLGFNQDTWHCFHCDESGNLFSLIMKYKNIDFKDTLKYISEKYNLVDEYKKAKEKYIQSKKSEAGIEETDIDNFLIIKLNRAGKRIVEGVNIDKVAEYIEKKFDIRTIFGIREESIEVYNDGVWTVKGRGIIKAEVERLLGIYSRNNTVNEVLEKIKRRTEKPREEADNIPDFKRCVKNGVLDLENVDNIKFLEHSKDYNFRNKFPIEYNPSATCVKILEFIKETFYEDDIPKIQEWFGLHLIRRYAFKRAVIFHGPKNTGKTVVLNLLTNFLGDNVSGLSLQEISRGKPFDLLALKDKDGNICDDLSSGDMKAIGGFKMAVGDGWINGEMKFGDKCRFRNTAKDTNACNKIPNSGEDIDDEAYYERIILIPVENVIPKDKMNKKLIDELTTPEELSGLLNWAIEGYIRLLKQNGFSNEKTPEETKFLMLQKGNSLAEFSAEVLIQCDGEKIDKETLYQVYCNWCHNHKPRLSPDSKDKIGKTLTKFCSYALPSSNGKERYWLNVKINDSYYTFQKNMSIYGKEDNKGNNDVNIDTYVISKPVIPVNKELDSLDSSKEDNDKPEVEVIKINTNGWSKERFDNYQKEKMKELGLELNIFKRSFEK